MKYKRYCCLLFLLITTITTSCSRPTPSPELNFSQNDVFEKKFGNEIAKIKNERKLQEANAQNGDPLNPKNANNFFSPNFQYDNSQDKSNSFNYVDISYLGSQQPKQHFPDYETYQQGATSMPNNGLSPRVFEISYNTYLNPPFSNSGEEFDVIDIPEVDSFGVRSSSNNKNYTLVPIESVRNAVKTINDSKTLEDMEFSKKIIAEKKVLLRRKKLDRYQEKNQYVKFFQNSAVQANNQTKDDPLDLNFDSNSKKN